MKTIIRESSIQAYHSHPASGHAGTQEQRILQFLKSQPGREFSRHEISAVAGRVNSLVESGGIDECANRLCSISRKTIVSVRALVDGQRGLF